MKKCVTRRKVAFGTELKASLKNFDREHDKRLLVGPTEDAKEVVGKVKEDCENIGLTIDLNHLPLLKKL